MANIALKRSLGLVALATLAACSSNSGDDTAPTLFFGTNDAAASGNGADFADDNTVIADLDGQTFNVRVVRTFVDTTTGEIRKEIVNEVASRNAGGPLFLTLDGEELEFEETEIAVREDGTILGAFIVGDGDFSRVFGLLTDENLGGRPGIIEAGAFVTGFETNPDTIAAMAGSVTYSGQFSGSGASTISDGFAASNGDMTLVADFGANMISGTLDLTIENRANVENDGFGINLALAPTAITGNGFTGDLTATSCSEVSCASDSQVGGVFFGPNANEISGIAQLDLSSTDADGNTSTFTGSGGFTAGQGVD